MYSFGKEELKLSVFAEDMIVYVENPKDTTRKLPELINEFSKVAGYKINTQKSFSFLYTNNERSEREIKETIPFTIASKRIKYLAINLLKEMTDLYSKNYKKLMTEIKNRRKKYTMFLDWRNQYCQNDYTTQGNLQIQYNPYQITNDIFHKLEQFFKILYGKAKDPE